MGGDNHTVIRTFDPGENGVGAGHQTIILDGSLASKVSTGPTSIYSKGGYHGFSLTQSQITSAAGAMAGFCAGVSVCPLDVAKTRLQAQGSYLKHLRDLNPATVAKFDLCKYRGLIQTMSVIWKEEGIRGLYRGLVPITLGYFPSWMIYFSCYEQCKRISGRFIQDENLSYFMSAILSGAASTTATNPIWVVKTRMMLQTDNGKTIYDRLPVEESVVKGGTASASKPSTQWYNGTFDAFRKMYKEEGIGSFYRGLLPSYFGLVHVAIQFPLYENLKKWFRIQDYMSPDVKERDVMMFLKFVLASSLSKMIASAVTYPHEIVRTRMQMYSNSGLGENQFIGVLKTISSIYVNEGMRGFYSGFVVNLTRTVPASAITMVSFEYFKKVLQRFNKG
ncbi:DEKNAAC105015 [Brettanomyces naardenensis]|uniref:DEKNAAC105015 n=1 Tax=Brettanomyces naardenensis TaxID=13370 RepID=A0A448YS59_BRENA|nr:DEKNAAC105015 [Brettanomyces naardenensis]